MLIQVAPLSQACGNGTKFVFTGFIDNYHVQKVKSFKITVRAFIKQFISGFFWDILISIP